MSVEIKFTGESSLYQNETIAYTKITIIEDDISRKLPPLTSKVNNCCIIPKNNEAVVYTDTTYISSDMEAMFYSTPIGIFANLDGYAIIPKEEYDRLLELDGLLELEEKCNCGCDCDVSDNCEVESNI
jgi:hypothetical protein